MNSILRKAAILLLLTGMLLSACGHSLWGSNNPDLTPTDVPPAAASETPTSTFVLSPESTSTDTPTPTATNIPPAPTATFNVPQNSILYFAQSGDSLEAVAAHFGVMSAEVSSPASLSATGFLNPQTPLFIPNRLVQAQLTPSTHILPDSELVFSPTATTFDTEAYVTQAGGYLSTMSEWLDDTGWTPGGSLVRWMAYEGSINPRLLLAIIQYYSGWVSGTPKAGVNPDAPLGYDYSSKNTPLYQQLRLTVQDLAAGYYGWRGGTLTSLKFPDGTSLRLAPDLNAGTVALYYMFSKRYNQAQWLQVIDPKTGFMALYGSMFGDPWARARQVEPLFPPGLNQPVFTLPFEVGQVWAFTGGPHSAWEQESVFAALDFAPASAEGGCVLSDAWEVAIAPGLVVRSGFGYVILDYDGDGFEQTGWDVLYMHVATRDRVAVGTWVNTGDRIGHPSCEPASARATGTHLHIARKYNGEWVGSGGPLPFVMSGWTAHYGKVPYKGTLTKGDKTVTSSENSVYYSQLSRGPGE